MSEIKPERPIESYEEFMGRHQFPIYSPQDESYDQQRLRMAEAISVMVRESGLKKEGENKTKAVYNLIHPELAFTREDVSALRALADPNAADDEGIGGVARYEAQGLNSLADRIEVLLPPE